MRWLPPAVAASALALAAGCAFEVTHDGSRFTCADGVCPAGFSCVDAVCYPANDLPPDDEPDAAPDVDAPAQSPDPDAAGTGGPPDAAPLAADAAPPPCVEGDVNTTDPATGTCYMRLNVGLSWDNAGLACESLGGRLAEVTSAEENAVVRTLFVMGGAPDAWLGGTDRNTEGTWRWRSGPLMDYDNWRLGEPNNGDGTGVENCLVIELDTAGTWDDRPCGSANPFICER